MFQNFYQPKQKIFKFKSFLKTIFCAFVEVTVLLLRSMPQYKRQNGMIEVKLPCLIHVPHNIFYNNKKLTLLLWKQRWGWGLGSRHSYMKSSHFV